jgi:hypothetical protein
MQLVQEVMSNGNVQKLVTTNEELINTVIEKYSSIIIRENIEIVKSSHIILESTDLDEIHNNISNFMTNDLTEFLETVSLVVSDQDLTLDEKKDCLFNIEEGVMGVIGDALKKTAETAGINPETIAKVEDTVKRSSDAAQDGFNAARNSYNADQANPRKGIKGYASRLIEYIKAKYNNLKGKYQNWKANRKSK